MGKRTYVRAGGTWVDVTTGAAFPASSTAPTSPVTGQVYFDTDDQKPYIWNGTAWVLFTPNLTDAVNTTSSTIAASATAVKTAYDLANAAIPKSTVTTAGDIIYGTASSTLTRLGIGTAGQVLTVNAGATAPSWAAAQSSSTLTVESKTASFTIPAGDAGKLYRCETNNVTITLPSDATATYATGSMIHVLRNGSQNVIFAAGASATVNTTYGLTLRAQNSAATLIKTAANTWTIVGDTA